MRASFISLAAVACMFLSGCGGSSSSSTPIMIQSGNWNITANSTTSPGNSFVVGGGLTQTGTTITGNLGFINSACFDPTAPVLITGSVNGQKITLTSGAIAGQTLTITATGSSPTALSGTYSVTGTGCATGDRGTIAANLVPPVTGSWHGSFTLLSGAVVNTTATLTQSPTADALGDFEITGTVNFTGTPCFTSGTISTGFMIGDAFLLDITTNDQPTPGNAAIGAIMDDPATATSATANYAVISGNCANDTGNGKLTKP